HSPPGSDQSRPPRDEERHLDDHGSVRFEIEQDDFFVCRLLLPSASTLFPYTTLFRSRQHIVVTEIPYQVNKSRLIEHAAALDQKIGKHTSELQSRGHLVCRLLLEKKNACTIDKGIRDPPSDSDCPPPSPPAALPPTAH